MAKWTLAAQRSSFYFGSGSSRGALKVSENLEGMRQPGSRAFRGRLGKREVLPAPLRPSCEVGTMCECAGRGWPLEAGRSGHGPFLPQV